MQDILIKVYDSETKSFLDIGSYTRIPQVNEYAQVYINGIWCRCRVVEHGSLNEAIYKIYINLKDKTE